MGGDELEKIVSDSTAQEIVTKLSDNLEQNISILEAMISKTEDFYGLVAARLPEIEQNIDETIEETELLINYFIETESNESEVNGGFQMAEVLGNLQKRINQVYDSLSARDEISEVLEGFVIDSTDDQAQFSEVLNLIEELDEVLSELEDLSINAIIVSSKAGDKGAGFRVISNEINRLSADIKEKYNFIEESMLNLQNWYDDFTDDLHRLAEIEETVATDYKQEVKGVFNEILASLQTISDMLKDFMDHINQAVAPIYDIMVLTQNQDIIRQNLENLIKIISNTYQEVKGLNLIGMGDKEILDHLVFMSEVFNLSQKLMTNILQQLQDSLFAIQDKFTEMDLNLNEIKEDGKELTSFLAGRPEEENRTVEEERVSLELIYQNLINFIPKLTNALEELDDKYVHVLDNKMIFYDNMKKIQEQFTEINGVANQFNKIRLLAKIEFSRMPTAKQSFADDIEAAIKDFINSSDHNQRLYSDLKVHLEENYKQFMAISSKTRDTINQSNEVIAESEDKLLLTKRLIKEAIQALQQSINDLVSEVTMVNQQIDECHTLQTEGQSVIDSLEEFKLEVIELKESYLEKAGLESWEEHNERLQELVIQFTSYLERKTAQDEIDDLDIEVGSEGGELTLF